MNVPAFSISFPKVSGSSTIHFAFQDFFSDSFSKYFAMVQQDSPDFQFAVFFFASCYPALILWFCYGNTPGLIANSLLSRIRYKLLSQENPQRSGLNKTYILHVNGFKILFFFFYF